MVRWLLFGPGSCLQPHWGDAAEAELNEFKGGEPCVSRERFWLDHQGRVDDEIELLNLYDLIQKGAVTLHEHDLRGDERS